MSHLTAHRVHASRDARREFGPILPMTEEQARFWVLRRARLLGKEKRDAR